MSRIYALLSVKFSGLKMCECKKNDKYHGMPPFGLEDHREDDNGDD